MNTSAASTVVRMVSSSGLVIAQVSPASMAMARKAVFSAGRPGSPKETFEASQTVFTPSSSRRRRTKRNSDNPAVGTAPIGMASGSMSTSWRGTP